MGRHLRIQVRIEEVFLVHVVTRGFLHVATQGAREHLRGFFCFFAPQNRMGTHALE